MRASLVIAASLVCLAAGAAPARAADLAVEAPAYESCCYGGYGAAAPLVILDDEPGVVIRRWWLPPWRGVHYYPHGRERLHGETHWRQPRPARSFSRYWTNPPAYVLDSSPLIRPEAPPPRRPVRFPPPGAAAH